MRPYIVRGPARETGRTMQSVRIVIPDPDFEKLAELARASYRGPRQQAAIMLLRAIEREAKARPARADVPERDAKP